ncbi:ribonucleotide-diphosphate reductase subunit beta [Paenalkalicoccus suaedae]|uniref:Ribonucleoside-diphosphate reductase subunit beta n=1 Tax=Paenalkalicoccus suaedae TaxID=2592382 RepID=A0A859FEE2_9BACI|nr:ribonucleotide-diphosphate reductase subunit beta [Paenalkalicoccus suaedae]QKS70596.1 ribonucleotide-diphosphate reductase subunit beta [Paenalkalicoccus suaedae]
MLITKRKLYEPSEPMKSPSLLNGKASGLLNWNDITYPHMYDLYQALLSNFWKAQEINMQDDIKQWDHLSDNEKDVFLRINTQLASLDSLQTPTMTLVMDYVSDPSFQAILAVIAQQEAVHNESYSYILSSLVSTDEQKRRFEGAKADPLVRKRNAIIVEAYDEFHEKPSVDTLFRLAVQSINLEGIYFYAGFAFFYHLARQQKMLKSSTMISYIQRDEMQHAYFMSQFLQLLMEEHPELKNEAHLDYIYSSIKQATALEQEWARDILKDTGINLDEYERYVEYLANKRCRQLGLQNAFPEIDNPMPWIHVFSDSMMNDTKSDFFEQKARTYAKVTEQNGFDEL